MTRSPFRPPSRVLISGLTSPEQTAAIAAHLRRHGLEPVGLPAVPPAGPEAFRELTRNAVCALLDLDQPGPALEWQTVFRSRRPTLPLLALFEHAGLAELLPASSDGLDGALRLPVRDAAFDRFITPWVPALAATRSDSDSGLAGSVDALDSPAQPPANPLPARHLSPLSSANQALLGQLAGNPQCKRFIVHGPVGAEFHLVARELAALRGMEDAAIQFSPRAPNPGDRLLVTSDPIAFERTKAQCALLIDTDRLVESGTNCVVLTLRPLYRRPQDVAFYVKRWLPELASVSHRSPPLPSPLPLTWCQALLTCSWPGEFAQLWSTLQRLAVLPEDEPFPSPLDAEVSLLGFNSARNIACARAFRARLATRIPEGLLPSVLSALGCPELPSSHV